jgi:hypothetical protein
VAPDRGGRGGDVKARWLLCLLLNAVGLFAVSGGDRASAQQRAVAEIEILSKADAVRLFGLTKDQWLREVRRAVASSAAKQTPGGDQRLFGLSTTTAEGDLLTVRLDYSQGDKRPAFIQVVVGYRPQRATQFDGQNLGDLVTAAQRQMAPEFDVVGRAERIEGGLGLFFTILEKRP